MKVSDSKWRIIYGDWREIFNGCVFVSLDTITPADGQSDFQEN